MLLESRAEFSKILHMAAARSCGRPGLCEVSGKIMRPVKPDWIQRKIRIWRLWGEFGAARSRAGRSLHHTKVLTHHRAKVENQMKMPGRFSTLKC